MGWRSLWARGRRIHCEMGGKGKTRMETCMIVTNTTAIRSLPKLLTTILETAFGFCRASNAAIISDAYLFHWSISGLIRSNARVKRGDLGG
jgi:hypothetical protein